MRKKAPDSPERMPSNCTRFNPVVNYYIHSVAAPAPNHLYWMLMTGLYRIHSKRKNRTIMRFFGGERGIRTLGGVLAHTRFPVVRLRPAQPSLHLNAGKQMTPGANIPIIPAIWRLSRINTIDNQPLQIPYPPRAKNIAPPENRERDADGGPALILMPFDPLGGVFQADAPGGQVIADFVCQREIFVLAGLPTLFDQGFNLIVQTDRCLAVV